MFHRCVCVFLLSPKLPYTEKSEAKKEKGKEWNKFKRIQRVIFCSFSLRSVDNHGVCKIQRQWRQTEQMNIIMNFCLIHRLNCARTTTHCYINTQIHLILLHIFCSFFLFSFLNSYVPVHLNAVSSFCSKRISTRPISLDSKKMVFRHFSLGF